MDLNARQEMFSDAYLHAVTSVAGITTALMRPDVDGIDWTLSAPATLYANSPKLDVQIKCLLRDAPQRGDKITYQLKEPHFNKLVGDWLTPRILVVVLVPKKIDEWLIHDEKLLSMYRCGYWCKVNGNPIPNPDKDKKVSVPIPRSQTVRPETLIALLGKISRKQPI